MSVVHTSHMPDPGWSLTCHPEGPSSPQSFPISFSPRPSACFVSATQSQIQLSPSLEIKTSCHFTVEVANPEEHYKTKASFPNTNLAEQQPDLEIHSATPSDIPEAVTKVN